MVQGRWVFLGRGGGGLFPAWREVVGVDELALIVGPEPADAAFAALRLCDQVRRRRRVSGSVFGTICGSRPSALRTTAPSPVPP